MREKYGASLTLVQYGVELRGREYVPTFYHVPHADDAASFFYTGESLGWQARHEPQWPQKAERYLEAILMTDSRRGTSTFQVSSLTDEDRYVLGILQRLTGLRTRLDGRPPESYETPIFVLSELGIEWRELPEIRTRVYWLDRRPMHVKVADALERLAREVDGGAYVEWDTNGMELPVNGGTRI